MRRILLIFTFALLTSVGCFHKKSAVTPPTATPKPAAPVEPAPPAVIPPPVPSQPAPLESAPLETTISVPSNLELGEMYFQLGNYHQAIKPLEISSSNSKAKNRDKALYLLGLSRALASDSSRDLRLSEAAFKKLISEFPHSPFKKQAELILSLQVQIDKLKADAKERDDRIKKLSDELQALKEIDLGRRPSRPPE
jgi:hypothetical protein